MRTEKKGAVRLETGVIESELLHRRVRVDYFLPPSLRKSSSPTLLLINDGQDMEQLGLQAMLEQLYQDKAVSPLFCVGIHAGDRMMEYGTAHAADYQGRGNKAGLYAKFIFKELLAAIHQAYPHITFREKAIAGFSMGGLSALDIAWNHSTQFSRVGVFSGSLWWRVRGLEEGYEEDRDRIMHAQVRFEKHKPKLKFFFEAGTLDETMDRNKNGIIDAIDDTITLIDELVKKGYHPKKDIRYLELEGGRHDIATWAKAMPEFLKWGWGKMKRPL
ncbi:MAG: esterase [Williamsia sp.]|nr:esterase [Williamsia sp.]